jgi:hypothetical protein
MANLTDTPVAPSAAPEGRTIHAAHVADAARWPPGAVLVTLEEAEVAHG